MGVCSTCYLIYGAFLTRNERYGLSLHRSLCIYSFFSGRIDLFRKLFCSWITECPLASFILNYFLFMSPLLLAASYMYFLWWIFEWKKLLDDFPNHRLVLKKGAPTMLLRNISQSSGLRNGTRRPCSTSCYNHRFAHMRCGLYS